MSWAHRLRAALWGGVLLCALQPASAGENDRLDARAPEQALTGEPPGQRAAAPLPRPWFAVRLQGDSLEITEVTRTRASRDRRAASGTAASSPPAPKPAQALDLPPGALLAVQPLYDGASDAWLRALRGRHANLLPAPALLTAQWRQPLKAPGTAPGVPAWELFTDVQRRPDGQLLAGSLRLLGRTGPDGAAIELMPAAHGMAFQRQDLLWAGWLPGHTAPGLLVQRTRLTGELEHLLILNGQIATAHQDPDAPTVSFSSGVDEGAGFELTPFGQKRPPEDMAEKTTLQFDAQDWVQRLEAARKTPLVPRRLMQQQASLGGEPIKVWVDYLPRLAYPASSGSAPAPASTTTDEIWGGELVIKVEFRGKTSVLMEAGFLESPLGIALGVTRDDTPALRMTYDPHYNNSFLRSWIWDDAAGRFRRWTNRHSQGC